MKISLRNWIVFSGLATVGILAWWYLSFSQMIFPDLKINRNQAISIAQNYLKKQNVNPNLFKTAAIFSIDESANRYLQKTIGHEALKEFIQSYDFQLFFWRVRFYQPESKEEYRLVVDSKSGDIIQWNHIIEETAARPAISVNDAQEKGWAFLQNKFHHSLDNYEIQNNNKTLLEFRTDYSFSWKDKRVSIPWNTKPKSGVARFLTNITISGNDILSYTKNFLKVPDDFSRDLNHKKTTGHNISVIVKIFYYILLVGACYVLLTKHNHLALLKTKRTYLILSGTFFSLSIANEFNLSEILSYKYPTTIPIISYYWQTAFTSLFGILIVSLVILIPGIAAEWLHFQNPKNKREWALFEYIQSTFFSPSVASSILMGYLGFAILLGLQACIFFFGERYWGVWKESQWLTPLSSAYIPFLTAFIIGWNASVQEEILYRFFGIHWIHSLFHRFRLSPALKWGTAVLITSLIWGLAHTNYPVFPLWFRGLEVTILGIFMGYFYLRFGLISVLVSHYIFDVFWGSLEFLFSPTMNAYQISAFIVLAIPGLFAILALLKKNQSKNLPQTKKWELNKNQTFNAKVLTAYLLKLTKDNPDISEEDIKINIIQNGWDRAVIETAFINLKRESPEQKHLE